MGDAPLWILIYLSSGAMLGQFHLFRCKACGDEYASLGNHFKYVAASALVALPTAIVAVVRHLLSDCGDE